jgi:hypothetical protein
MLNSIPTYVDLVFGFLVDPEAASTLDQITAPATAPAAAAAAGVPTKPVPPANTLQQVISQDAMTRFYVGLMDELEDHADITDPEDRRYLSGGDHLARSDALLFVMKAEKTASAAGLLFDRMAFANASDHPSVIAAAGYLRQRFVLPPN